MSPPEPRGDPARQDRLYLRREEQHAAVPGVVQGLDAEPVPYQDEALALAVIDGEGEHPVKPPHTLRTPLLVGVQDDLRIGARTEHVAEGLQLALKGAEVVHLPVVRDPDRPCLITHRLVSQGGEVQDAEPATPQADLSVGTDIQTGIVRSPMPLHVAHPGQSCGVCSSRIPSPPASNPTHTYCPSVPAVLSAL